MITAFSFFYFCSFYVTRHSQRQRSIHFTTGRILYCFSLPFTTHGVEDTASLIDWHLSFSMCFLNVFFPCFFLLPFFTFQVSGLHPTCRIAVQYAETLVRHYILIPFLFGRVYQAGTYFVGKATGKKGIQQTMALGIPLNHFCDLLYFVFFFSLQVAHFHCID